MKQIFQKHAPLVIVIFLAFIVVIETGLLIGGYLYYQTMETINEDLTYNKNSTLKIKKNPNLDINKSVNNSNNTAYKVYQIQVQDLTGNTINILGLYEFIKEKVG